MEKRQVVLVTGVAGYWGSRVAARLVDGGEYHTIGLDVTHPAREIRGLDFVLADIRNPLLKDLLQAEEVDTVCHLAFVHSARRSERSFDVNVMGTTKLLGACAEAGVRKVVLKSSTTVYGARPRNSAFLTETHTLRGSRRYGYIYDRVQIEEFCNGFYRRVPQISLTLLRFANTVGRTADTPLIRFLRNPWAPSLVGFDPMMQVIHEDDVVDALLHAVRTDVSGVFNVAAEGPLPLSKIRGLVGKFPLAVYHSFAYWSGPVLGIAGLDMADYLPLDPDYLRYPWVGSLTRMRDSLGFVPRYTSSEALRDFAAELRLGRYRTGSDGLAEDEEQLAEVISRRLRARECQAPPAITAEEGGSVDD